MGIKYDKFDETFIENKHGRIYYFRDLYLGKHAKIFKRAAALIEEGELVANLMTNQKEVPFTQTPYIVANFTKLIAEVPAILVSRSIGKIDTAQEADGAQIAASNADTDETIEGTTDTTINGTIVDLQHELIQQIVKNSKLDKKHWSNIVMHQVDGGIVGVPWDDDRGLRIEFKGKDVYFPHEDERGADLTYHRTIDDEQYLHVYRERMMKAGEEDEDDGWIAAEDGLRCRHMLFMMGQGSIIEEDLLEDEEAADLLNMELDDLEEFYPGRDRLFINYWGNEITFMNPLGVSALDGQEDKQDEINWTLTRAGMVFERNGKPRIAINKEMAKALSQEMVRLYGKEAAGKFDHRMFEVTTMDDKGNSMQIIQIDITKIGDVQWVKDLVKLMLMETKTSEKAIDFYMGEGGGGAQSGIAKFYDLFLSLMKAEMLQKEYINFLKELVEDALWLQNRNDPAVIIEQPIIQTVGMFPVQRKEVVDENIAAMKEGAQSRETTVRNINSDKPEDWIQEELAKIEAEKATANVGLQFNTPQTLNNLLDNPLNRQRAAAASDPATPATPPAPTAE